MQNHNLDITLGVGNISMDEKLNGYYQDFSPAIVRITGGIFANLDEEGVPYSGVGNQKKYYIVTVIQYGLMCYDLVQKGIDVDKNMQAIKTCLNWLDRKKEHYKESYVWRSDNNRQYGLKNGWVSGMYQGQAISLYLRAYQLFNDKELLETAEKVFNSFSFTFEDGGFKRIDEQGCLWFEEYPTPNPSYVLNGFIYSMFGILDFYRVTDNKMAKEIWDSCVHTLETNLPKYDVWHWSVYDQLKKQLVSYYYQKNVHVPLMKIMFDLTQKDIFDKYANKWEKNLNNPLHKLVTQIMYRVQPRLMKLKNKLSK